MSVMERVDTSLDVFAELTLGVDIETTCEVAGHGWSWQHRNKNEGATWYIQFMITDCGHISPILATCDSFRTSVANPENFDMGVRCGVCRVYGQYVLIMDKKIGGK